MTVVENYEPRSMKCGLNNYNTMLGGRIMDVLALVSPKPMME